MLFLQKILSDGREGVIFIQKILSKRKEGVPEILSAPSYLNMVHNCDIMTMVRKLNTTENKTVVHCDRLSSLTFLFV